MTVYGLLSRRYLGHRWDRAVLVAGSIALGVATLTSTRILNRCLQQAADITTNPLAGDAGLTVANGESGVPFGVIADLRNANLPGVEQVRPVFVGRVSLTELNQRSAVLIGADLASGPLAAGEGVTLTPTGEGPLLGLAGVQAAALAGDSPGAAARWAALPGRPAIISRGIQSARESAGRTGKPLVVRYAGRDLTLTPVAIIDFPADSPIAALGTNLIGLEIEQVARLGRPSPTGTAALQGTAAAITEELLNPPLVTRVDLLLVPGTKPETVQEPAQAIVGVRAAVRTPEQQTRATQEIIDGVQIAFTLCSLAAMVVGLFLVYNAMAVTVTERRPDIGVLRSLGATRPQVVGLFCALAFLLGLLGAIAGVPLGIGMARFALGQFQDELGAVFLAPGATAAWPSTATVLLAAFAGVVTAVAAALIPAVQAATQDPAEVVRRAPDPARAWRRIHRLTCLVLIVGGVLMVVARHDLPPRVGSFGGLMIALVGLLLSAPILVGILVRLVNPVLRRILPIEARLAADNLLRAPGRTGVVVGALGAGVAVMVQTAGVGRSNEEPVVAWLHTVLQADRFVFAGDLAGATSSQAPIDPAVVSELRTLPGVESVVGFRYARPEFNGTIIFVVALDAAAYADHTAARAGRAVERFARVGALSGQRGVVASDNFLVKHNVKVGDTLTIPSGNGPVNLTILDAVTDYSWSRGTLFMDWPVYAELFRDPLVDLCHVYLSDDATGGPAVQQLAADRGLLVQDRATVRQFLSELIDRVYLLAYLQQLVVGLVAALGVVTALLISVLQRKRELGLLLAVGATPGQVIRSVLAEALLMGGFGTILGVLIGLPMEYYVLELVMPEESGFQFDMIIPWRQIAVVAGGAVTVAALAGLLPAMHAVRTRIPEAIAYE